MAENAKRGAKSPDMSKTVTVSVRLDPKLKYLAEIAAREQRRALSSYIEWAVAQSLEKCELAHFSDDNSRTLAEEADYLWDIDEPDRLVKLALRYPHLLTHEEQILWKLIRENGRLWRGRYDQLEEWRWTVSEDSIMWDKLRETWPKFVEVAEGTAGPEVLPVWQRTKPSVAPPPVARQPVARPPIAKPPSSNPRSTNTGGFDDMDDDIPF